ncbi:GNAT family N-acetyltransferase [Arthrobacter sp. TMN-50]
MKLSIRSETFADHGLIFDVLAAAFRSHSGPITEPLEVGLTRELFASAAYLPELSLVAEKAGTVVGFVMTTRGWIGLEPSLGLGPIGVHPEAQRLGIGAALMRETITCAETLGETSIALFGAPAFYSRFGFGPASGSGVLAPDPSWGDYFMIRTLGGASTGRGTFAYAAPFTRI